MAAKPKRINVTLDEEHASKLAHLAERTHIQEGVRERIAVLAEVVDVVGLTDNHAVQARMSPLAAVDALHVFPLGAERDTVEIAASIRERVR